MTQETIIDYFLEACHIGIQICIKLIYISIKINQLICFNRICSNSSYFYKQIFKFLANLFYNNNYPINFLKYYLKIVLKKYGNIVDRRDEHFKVTCFQNILYEVCTQDFKRTRMDK